MDEEQKDSGFIRQRRNLMVISLVLLFSEVAQLTMKKLNVLGTELEIDRPQVVTWALWAAGIYWLIRYYQYSRPRFRDMRLAIYQKAQEWALPEALTLALETNPDFSKPYHDLPAKPVVTAETYTIKGQTPDYLDVELQLRKDAVEGMRAIGVTLGKVEVRIEGARLRKLRMRAFLHLSCHTAVFTDFVFPYLIFLAPVCYGSYQLISRYLGSTY